METNKRIMRLAELVLEGNRGKTLQEFRAVAAANGYTGHRGGLIRDTNGTAITRGWERFGYLVCMTKEIVLHEPQAIAEMEDVEEAEAEEMEQDTAPSKEKVTDRLLIHELATDVMLGHQTSTGMKMFQDIAFSYGYQEDRWSFGIIDTMIGKMVCRAWATFAGRVLSGEVQLPRDMDTARKAAGILDMEDATSTPESTPLTLPRITYLSTTRTPTVSLTQYTDISATFTEDISDEDDGLCQSGASLECSRENPNPGIMRFLPESMLPGSQPERMLQCLPCYEASALAYIRKLHKVS
jgi:hypothetical protein